MGCGAAEACTVILDFTQSRNYQKSAENKSFHASHKQYVIIKHFAAYFWTPKEGEKHTFLPANGFTTCFLWRHVS